MSHGRGGAGNMGTGTNDVDPNDLQTPTIKSQNYTTGRGGAQPFPFVLKQCANDRLVQCTNNPLLPGQGNIVSNDNPDNARLAQDVDAPSHHAKPEPTTGTSHWGRGGEGNMVTLGTGEQKPKKERSVSRGEAGHEKPSLIERGKSALGLGHKKESA